MSNPSTTLAHFRAESYQRFGLRRDSLFDLHDAILTSGPVTSLVRLSLEPGFRRQWSSLFDALTEGTLDTAALRRVWTRYVPPPRAGERVLWVIDGSTWPRPAAKTSAERTFCRFTTAGTPQSGIIPGWDYQWVVMIPEMSGSWVLPLDITRRNLTAGTPTELAITQLRAVLAAHRFPRPRPVVALDSHYDVPALIAAVPDVDLLARLAANRRFYREPPPPSLTGTGRPRKHGPIFRLKEPATQHDPVRTQVFEDPGHGQVTITVWTGLHTQPAPTIALTVLKVAVSRLPNRPTPPAPLWLVWSGADLPEDLATLWHWFQRRFTIEHAFRLLKQELGWTTARLRSPAAADRWSWLQALVLWELWLARPVIQDRHLPWEQPQPATRLPPGRVRRGMAGLLRSLGSPVRPPQPRGKASGRGVGTCPGPATRYPVQSRAPTVPPNTA
jgi:hypothetical protein